MYELKFHQGLPKWTLSEPSRLFHSPEMQQYCDSSRIERWLRFTLGLLTLTCDRSVWIRSFTKRGPHGPESWEDRDIDRDLANKRTFGSIAARTDSPRGGDGMRLFFVLCLTLWQAALALMSSVKNDGFGKKGAMMSHTEFVPPPVTLNR